MVLVRLIMYGNVCLFGGCGSCEYLMLFRMECVCGCI